MVSRAEFEAAIAHGADIESALLEEIERLAEEGQKVMGYYTTKLAFQRLQGRDAWTAQHTELVGCHAVRGTAAEALRALDDEREAWIEHARSRSVYIPDPERVLPLFIMTLGTDSTEVHEREAIEAIEDYTKRLDAVPTTADTTPELDGARHFLAYNVRVRGADVGRPSLGFERATGSDPGWLCEVANAIEAGNGEAFDLPRLLRNAAHALRGRPSPDAPALVSVPSDYVIRICARQVRDALAYIPAEREPHRASALAGLAGLEEAIATLHASRGGHPSEPSPHPDDCKCACYRRGFEDA